MYMYSLTIQWYAVVLFYRLQSINRTFVNNISCTKGSSTFIIMNFGFLQTAKFFEELLIWEEVSGSQVLMSC